MTKGEASQNSLTCLAYYPHLHPCKLLNYDKTTITLQNHCKSYITVNLTLL